MKKIIIFAMILFYVVGCSVEKKNNYHQISFPGFDTFLELTALADDENVFNEKFKNVTDSFVHYNELFDIYNDYTINNIKTINDNAGIKPVKVEQEIIDLLLMSKEFYEITNHELDITSGRVLKIWHEYRDEGIALNQNGLYGELPSKEILEEANACSGWENIEIDKENKTVFIKNKCTLLDVGAVAKGYSTELEGKKLEEIFSQGTLNAGGNVRTINKKNNGDPWYVGIQSPNKNDLKFFNLALDGENISYVTSGDYQRFYLIEKNQRMGHIIDKDTLYPPNYYRAVTIVTNNSAYADALSTALFTSSYEACLEIIENFKMKYPNEIIEVIWIVDKGEILPNENKFDINDFSVYFTDGLKEKIIIE